MLGDELNLMVQRYFADTRRLGGAISTDMVRAGVRGILLNQDKQCQQNMEVRQL